MQTSALLLELTVSHVLVHSWPAPFFSPPGWGRVEVCERAKLLIACCLGRKEEVGKGAWEKVACSWIFFSCLAWSGWAGFSPIHWSPQALIK